MPAVTASDEKTIFEMHAKAHPSKLSGQCTSECSHRAAARSFWGDLGSIPDRSVIQFFFRFSSFFPSSSSFFRFFFFFLSKLTITVFMRIEYIPPTMDHSSAYRTHPQANGLESNVTVVVASVTGLCDIREFPAEVWKKGVLERGCMKYKYVVLALLTIFMFLFQAILLIFKEHGELNL